MADLEQKPTVETPGKEEAFLVGAFSVGVHFLTGFFVAATIFLVAMPVEPPVVRKTMMSLAIAFALAGSLLGTMVSPVRRPARNLGMMLLFAGVASLLFLSAVKFTVDDPRMAKMAADTGTAIGFGGDTAAFLARIQSARLLAAALSVVGAIALVVGLRRAR